jgi:hypothetical protein
LNILTDDIINDSFSLHSCVVVEESIHAQFQLYDLYLPPSIAHQHRKEIEGRVAVICVPKSFVDQKARSITIPSSFVLNLYNGQNVRNLQSDDSYRSQGIKSLLAVRVTTIYGEQPDETTDLIEGTIFGTGNEAQLDSVTSQYSAVSHGALRFVPAFGSGISRGVVEVQIPIQMAGSDIQKDVMAKVLEAVESLIGHPLSVIASHVVFCVPNNSILQGTTEWTAFTFLNEGVSFIVE